MGSQRSEMEAELRSLEERKPELDIVRSYLRTRVLARRVIEKVPGAEALVLNYPEDLDDDIRSTYFEPQTRPPWVDEDFDERYFDAILTTDALVRDKAMLTDLKKSFNSADWGHYIGNLTTLPRTISDVDALKLIGWPSVLTLDEDEIAYDRYLAEEEIFQKPYRVHRQNELDSVGVFLLLGGETIADVFANFEVQHPVAMQLAPDANLAEVERALATVDEEISKVESAALVISTLILSAAVRADHPGAVSLTVGRTHPRLGEVYLLEIIHEGGHRLDFREPSEDAWDFTDCYTYWHNAPLAVEIPGQYESGRKLYSGMTGQQLTEIRSIPLEDAVIRATATQGDVARG